MCVCVCVCVCVRALRLLPAPLCVYRLCIGSECVTIYYIYMCVCVCVYVRVSVYLYIFQATKKSACSPLHIVRTRVLAHTHTYTHTHTHACTHRKQDTHTHTTSVTYLTSSSSLSSSSSLTWSLVFSLRLARLKVCPLVFGLGPCTPPFVVKRVMNVINKYTELNEWRTNTHTQKKTKKNGWRCVLWYLD